VAHYGLRIRNDLQEGIRNLSLKGTESSIAAILILLIVAGLTGTAAVAALSSEQWVTYLHLFDESRLVSHTTSTLKYALDHRHTFCTGFPIMGV